MASKPLPNTALLAALLAGLAVAASPLSAAAQTRQEATIPLYLSGDRLLVMMNIGDSEIMPMMFDTGSDGSSIDNTVVARHRLEQIGEVIEIDGTTLTERQLPNVVIPSTTLGGVDVGAIEATALDYDRFDAMGIISPEIFQHSLVYVELNRHRARLVPRDTAQTPAGPAVPYFEGLPTINLTFSDGTVLPAHYDTGYDAPLSLPLSRMNTTPLMAPPAVIGRFKSIDTEGEVYGGRLRGCVQIGPVMLENPVVAFLGDITNIGLPVIRQLTLVLDPAGHRSWTIESEGPVAPHRLPRMLRKSGSAQPTTPRLNLGSPTCRA